MTIVAAFAISIYLIATFVLARHVWRGSAPARGIIVGLTSLALLAQGVEIWLTIRYAQGWDLSLFSALVLATWLMSILTLVLYYRRASVLGLAVYPLTAISLILKSAFPSSVQLLSDNPALEWHILLSLAAYAVAGLAALQAIVVAFQEQQLRQHHLGRLSQQLSPLQSLEAGLFQLLMAAFILLSASLLSGAVFVDDFFAQRLGHKTVFGVLSWLVFATLLWGRWQRGWRGATAVRWCLAGFALLLVAYAGSKVVLEFILTTA